LATFGTLPFLHLAHHEENMPVAHWSKEDERLTEHSCPNMSLQLVPWSPGSASVLADSPHLRGKMIMRFADISKQNSPSMQIPTTLNKMCALERKTQQQKGVY
jgi:hypothetical protein